MSDWFGPLVRCFTSRKAFVTPGTTPVSVFFCDRTACNHWLCLKLDKFVIIRLCVLRVSPVQVVETTPVELPHETCSDNKITQPARPSQNVQSGVGLIFSCRKFGLLVGFLMWDIFPKFLCAGTACPGPGTLVAGYGGTQSVERRCFVRSVFVHNLLLLLCRSFVSFFDTAAAAAFEGTKTGGLFAAALVRADTFAAGGFIRPRFHFLLDVDACAGTAICVNAALMQGFGTAVTAVCAKAFTVAAAAAVACLLFTTSSQVNEDGPLVVSCFVQPRFRSTSIFGWQKASVMLSIQNDGYWFFSLSQTSHILGEFWCKTIPDPLILVGFFPYGDGNAMCLSAKHCIANPSPHVFWRDWLSHHCSIVLGMFWWDLWSSVSSGSGANQGLSLLACFWACCTTVMRSSAASLHASSAVSCLPFLTQARAPATALYMQSPLPPKSFSTHCCSWASAGFPGRLWLFVCLLGGMLRVSFLLSWEELACASCVDWESNCVGGMVSPGGLRLRCLVRFWAEPEVSAMSSSAWFLSQVSYPCQMFLTGFEKLAAFGLDGAGTKTIVGPSSIW